MRLGQFEHLEPKSLSEACAILAEYGDKASVIAGGTDIVMRMKQRLLEPVCLVNIRNVEGSGEIRSMGGDLRAGALVTLTELQQSAAIREQAPILAEAAASVGATQLQNMGTIGGNLCLDTRCWYYNQSHAWRQARAACIKAGGDICYMAKGSKRCYALYSGDTAPALLALDAKVRIASVRGERVVPLEEIFVDDGKNPTTLRHDELLAEVIIPGPVNGQQGTYMKFRRRDAIDFPIVGVAATMTLANGICQQARIGVTGVGSAPFVAKASQHALIGKIVSRETIDEAVEAACRQAKPVSHMEVSAAYRKRLVGVLVKDALCKLAGMGENL